MQAPRSATVDKFKVAMAQQSQGQCHPGSHPTRHLRREAWLRGGFQQEGGQDRWPRPRAQQEVGSARSPSSGQMRGTERV